MKVDIVESYTFVVYGKWKKRDIESLNQCLIKWSSEIRSDAARALGSLAKQGVGHHSSIPFLNRAVQDKQPTVQLNAIAALGDLAKFCEIGDQSTLDVAYYLFGEKNILLRGFSAELVGKLARIGIGHPSLIPVLNEALVQQAPNALLLKGGAEESAELVRRNAAEALLEMANMGWGDQSSLPALEMLAKWGSRETRTISISAIESIQNMVLSQKPGAVDNGASKDNEKSEGHAEMGRVDPMLQLSPEEMAKKQAIAREFLSSIVSIQVPSFIDSGTKAQIFVKLENKTNQVLEDIRLDLSDLDEFFMVEGEVFVKKLRPDMFLENTIILEPRYHKGAFPVRIKVTSFGYTISKEQTIKVGGTEVY